MTPKRVQLGTPQHNNNNNNNNIPSRWPWPWEWLLRGPRWDCPTFWRPWIPRCPARWGSSCWWAPLLQSSGRMRSPGPPGSPGWAAQTDRRDQHEQQLTVCNRHTSSAKAPVPPVQLPGCRSYKEKFSSVHDGIYANTLGKAHLRSRVTKRSSVHDELGKTHLHSTRTLRSFPNAAPETVRLTDDSPFSSFQGR